MNKIKKTVLERIADEKIKPFSKTYLTSVKVLVFFLILIGLLLGGIAWGILFYFVQNTDALEFIWKNPSTFLYLIWIGMPLLWVILTICFGIGVSVWIKRSDAGYRHSLWFWLGIIILPQALMGIILGFTHLGDSLDRHFSKVSFYQATKELHIKRLWHSSEKGFMAGKITQIEEKTVTVTDLQDNKYTLINVPRIEKLKVDQMVRFRGKKEVNTIDVKDIFPMKRKEDSLNKRIRPHLPREDGFTRPPRGDELSPELKNQMIKIRKERREER